MFGSPAYWEFYDDFCKPENLRKLVEDPEFPLVKQMFKINEAAHRTREIHELSRPDRGWTHHMAWLALKDAPIQKHDGEFGLAIRAGDVIVVEHGWDRDVIITHCPIERNMVSGYLLSGKWPPMVGLFMPLFDRETILYCVELRLKQNTKDAIDLALEEAEDWGWFKK